MKFKVEEKNYRKTGVYCIENMINNKIYIGSTSVSFRQRYLQYASAFKKGLDNQPILYRAFRKYGFDNFEFKIIAVCSKEDCIVTEQFFIDKGTDYNSCLIAGSLLGFIHPRDSKTRTITKGKHHCAVKVDMYSLSGEFIKTFDSMVEAQIEMKIKSKSNISQCCKGKVFSAGKHRWAFKGSKLSKRVKRENGTCKIALKKDDFYKEFHSQKEVAEYLKSIGYCNCNQGLVSATIKRTGSIYNYKTIKI